MTLDEDFKNRQNETLGESPDHDLGEPKTSQKGRIKIKKKKGVRNELGRTS